MIYSIQYGFWLMLKKEPIIFISKMERLLQKEELKGRITRKAQEMEQSLLNKVGGFQCHMVPLRLFIDACHGCCTVTYLDL
jgi:hypothetical protein